MINASKQDAKHIFEHIINETDLLATSDSLLKAQCLETKLGPMIAISDEEALYFLEFLDHQGLARDIESLQQKTKSTLIAGDTQPLNSIQCELELYFEGKLTQFKTKLFLLGSPFQERVWKVLQSIPYGETHSYLEVAKLIGNESAHRAVARANATNRLPIIIPCHRVIYANGQLGGYNSGVKRKEWLLDLERHYKN
jgi:AraC family transcriptional regulator of adaptative response/methylated-DNA-[protein]-cysteine methyltransferase